MRALPLAAFLLALPAHAATLRGGTTLSGPAVRLSDLWDGVENDRAIGPGPELGGRIVVEAPQLGAIARQFGVDWRPSSSGERIVLDRPGRPLPRDQVMAALRAALSVAGVSDDAELEMPGFEPPSVPVGGSAHADVGQLDYDGATGRFTAMLSVTAAGMTPAHTRLSGVVQEMVELPVAAHRMLPGDVIGAGDIRMGRLHASAVRAEVAQSAAQAIGMAMRHTIGPGAPLPLADLGHPMAVQRGDPVQMALQSAGLSLSAQGIAMEAAAVGDQVRVLNPASRAVVEAEVVSAGRVRVIGATPVQLPPGATVPLRVAAR